MAPKIIWDAATNPAFNPNLDKSHKLLKENKPPITLIKKAVLKPRLYHPLLVSYDFELQELSAFKNMARLLALEARIHSQAGNISDALGNISYMNQIAAHLNQTPTLINVLVASVIQKEAMNTFEILIANKSAHTKIKVPLPVNTDSHILKSFRNGMVYETAFGASVFWEMMLNEQSSESAFFISLDEEDIDLEWKAFFWNHILAPLYRIFLFNEDRVSHELFWKKFHKYIKEPYYKSGLQLKQWEDQLSENLDLGFSKNHVHDIFTF